MFENSNHLCFYTYYRLNMLPTTRISILDIWIIWDFLYSNAQNLDFFFYTRTWLSPKGDSLPFAGGSHRTKRYKRKIHSHSHSLITTAQTLLGTPGEVRPDKLSAFRSSWGLVTPRTPNKTPLQDNNFQRSPTGGPDPPSYRVESVSLPTLYQSYYPISHTPSRIPI